jgi:hypothetical protein
MWECRYAKIKRYHEFMGEHEEPPNYNRILWNKLTWLEFRAVLVATILYGIYLLAGGVPI